MRKIPTSTNVAIFLLFFGVSLVDAIASHNWWRSAFWLAMGALFAAGNTFSRRA